MIGYIKRIPDFDNIFSAFDIRNQFVYLRNCEEVRRLTKDVESAKLLTDKELVDIFIPRGLSKLSDFCFCREVVEMMVNMKLALKQTRQHFPSASSLTDNELLEILIPWGFNNSFAFMYEYEGEGANLGKKIEEKVKEKNNKSI